MYITKFLKWLFPEKPQRVIPLHRFDDFTEDEIDIIEEAIPQKVYQHAEWASKNEFFAERYADRFKKLVLLWEEITLVAAKARSDRMENFGR